MRVVFLSDAHLRDERDEGYRLLLRFMKELEGTTDHLVIAGDLFDFWFCDGAKIYPEFGTIIQALINLRKSGVRISLIEGNHDFFMQEAFRGTGIEIIPDEIVLEIDGARIYIAHGDLVDRSNKRYLMLRRLLRSGFFFRLQRLLPAGLLWKIAGRCSSSSRRYMQERSRSIVEAMKLFARERIAGGMDAVILGHSHQPMIQWYTVDGKTGMLGLLGDWIEHYSYVVFENGRFTLEFYGAK
ncbi:MAG TPA: UDP-2,3-diacylglucosamine diphosphatase [Deltaproteobacteria bacterium]|nr:UDP-2,3-diacylglucosamine diphosphatase [Deltaproteobacteria bacterium]